MFWEDRQHLFRIRHFYLDLFTVTQRDYVLVQSIKLKILFTDKKAAHLYIAKNLWDFESLFIWDAIITKKERVIMQLKLSGIQILVSTPFPGLMLTPPLLLQVPRFYSSMLLVLFWWWWVLQQVVSIWSPLLGEVWGSCWQFLLSIL